jgi:hypothetical protein
METAKNADRINKFYYDGPTIIYLRRVQHSDLFPGMILGDPLTNQVILYKIVKINKKSLTVYACFENGVRSHPNERITFEGTPIWFEASFEDVEIGWSE